MRLKPQFIQTLIEYMGGGYKYLQIQELFSRAILMPMKDID